MSTKKHMRRYLKAAETGPKFNQNSARMQLQTVKQRLAVQQKRGK